MATIHRVFKYPSGYEERDEVETDEPYEVGTTCERDGIRWKAVSGGPLPADQQHVELIFVQDVE